MLLIHIKDSNVILMCLWLRRRRKGTRHILGRSRTYTKRSVLIVKSFFFFYLPWDFDEEEKENFAESVFNDQMSSCLWLWMKNTSLINYKKATVHIGKWRADRFLQRWEYGNLGVMNSITHSFTSPFVPQLLREAPQCVRHSTSYKMWHLTMKEPLEPEWK